MNGLHTSEFALVLRDSLSSTPRRLSICPPLSAPPPVRKKPRLPAVEPSPNAAHRSPPPVPPPLPSPRALALGPPPPALALPARMRNIDDMWRYGFPSSSSSSSSPTSFAPAGSPTSVKSPLQRQRDLFSMSTPPSHHHFRPPPPPPQPPTSAPVVQSLDVLASVSAEQRLRLPSGTTTTTACAPEITAAQQATAALLQMPTTPVTPPPATGQYGVQLPYIGSAMSSSSGRGKKELGPQKTRIRLIEKRRGKSNRPKSFSCNLCPSAFTERFNLNKHVRAVHERRRPFQCTTCHARFQQRDHMQKHEICVHKKLRQFACTACGASFGWRGVLKKHRKSVHHIMDG